MTTQLSTGYTHSGPVLSLIDCSELNQTINGCYITMGYRWVLMHSFPLVVNISLFHSNTASRHWSFCHAVTPNTHFTFSQQYCVQALVLLSCCHTQHTFHFFTAILRPGTGPFVMLSHTTHISLFHSNTASRHWSFCHAVTHNTHFTFSQQYCVQALVLLSCCHTQHTLVKVSVFSVIYCTVPDVVCLLICYYCNTHSICH